MSPRLRIVLAVVGVIIILCSLVTLAFAFGPIQHLSDQATVAPTMFAPPQSAVVLWGNG
jgi:hypothetical protein